MTVLGKILHGTVCVQDILSYVQNDHFMGKVKASQYLGISIRNIENRLEEIPHFRVGRKLLFKRSELDAWMEFYRESGNGCDLKALADDALATLKI